MCVLVNHQDAQGMPVCLQVMCGRLQEERVLTLATIIEQALRPEK